MEIDGNFSQLLALRSTDGNHQLVEWLKRKSSKYTGHDMQNEMLQVMALSILRKIAINVQSSKFTIMVDDTTDILHVHKDSTDTLDLIACANDFVTGNERRVRVFE